MKHTDLHTLLLSSPYIHYLETETDELCEGECSLWHNQHCTLLIDFVQTGTSNYYQQCLHAINEKLAWIHQQEAQIKQYIIEHSDYFKQTQTQPKSPTLEAFCQALYIDYISFYIENPDEIFIDFCLAADPDYLQEQTIEIELELDYSFSLSNNE